MKIDLQNILHFFNKSQEQFARDIGVSVYTVNRWIRNKHKPSSLALQKIEEIINAYKEEKLDEERSKKGAA